MISKYFIVWLPEGMDSCLVPPPYRVGSKAPQEDRLRVAHAFLAGKMPSGFSVIHSGVRRVVEVNGVSIQSTETETGLRVAKPLNLSAPLPPRPYERHVDVVFGTAAFLVSYKQFGRNRLLSSIKTAIFSPVPLNAVGAVLLSLGESSALTSLYVGAGVLNVLNEARLSYFDVPKSKENSNSRVSAIFNWAKSQLLSPGVCAGITSLVYASSATEFIFAGDYVKALGFALFSVGLRSVKTDVMEKIYEYTPHRIPTPFKIKLPEKIERLASNPGFSLATGNAILAIQKVVNHGGSTDLANLTSLVGIGIGGFVLAESLRGAISGKETISPPQAIATSGIGDSLMGLGTMMLGNLQTGSAFLIFGLANIWYGQLGVKQDYPKTNLLERLGMLIPHRA